MAFSLVRSLSGAEAQGAGLGGVNARGADFDGAELLGADLSHGVFDRATFRNTDLTGADLSDGHFSGADFKGATLHGTDIGGADLATAKNLTRDQVIVACADGGTKRPGGLAARRCGPRSITVITTTKRH